MAEKVIGEVRIPIAMPEEKVERIMDFLTGTLSGVAANEPDVVIGIPRMRADRALQPPPEHPRF